LSYTHSRPTPTLRAASAAYIGLAAGPHNRHCATVQPFEELTMIRSLAIASAMVVGGALFTGCAVVRDQQSVGSYIDDASITTQVKTRFANDPTVSAMSIQVETLKGVVQLSGFAKSERERATAENLARPVEGVSRVVNNILVRP
jgi:osmotically-inducible protein OsmY